MSRRSSSRIASKKKAASLPVGVTTGLASLVECNESIIASMLSVDVPKDSTEARAKLLSSLTECMSMNDLSSEALLARFFDASILRTYCERRLGVSSKGNAATLAARVAKAWSKPDFEPLPLEEEDVDSKKRNASTKKPKEGTKKRAEKEDESGETKKKRSTWTAAQRKPSFSVTAPPGPLGLTIKQYSDEFIISDVSSKCTIPEVQAPYPKVRPGDVVTTIDGIEIESVDDDILKDSDKSRVLEIGGGVISMNAADHPKGTLLHMKEAGFPMFRMMDYSDVAEKYGEEFLEELSPPNKGKSGKQILAGAMTPSLSKA